MRAIDIGLADVEKEAQKDRDAAIQSEIRALEIQSLREERVWKSRLDSDYEQVRGAYEEEERLLNSKIAKNKSLMVDQLAVKHNLLKSVNEEKSLLRIKSNQLSDLQEEVKIFENGIIAQKDRINDVKASHDLRKRELEAAHKSMVNLIVGSCSKLESDIQESINHTNSNIKSLEFSHTQNLEELNLKVMYFFADAVIVVLQFNCTYR